MFSEILSTSSSILEQIKFSTGQALKSENARLLASSQQPYYPESLMADLETYAQIILSTSPINRTNQTPLTFNQNLMRQKQRKRQLATTLTTQLSGLAISNDAGPIILQLITEHCQQQINAEIITSIHQALPNVDTAALSRLSVLELTAEYQRYMTFSQFIAGINNSFKYWVVDRSAPPNAHDISSFQVSYQVTELLQPTVEAAYKSAQFIFTAQDEINGYSMNNLLLMSEILETTYTSTGNIPPIYNGNHGLGPRFVLSYDELAKLKLYLSALYEQEKDFTGILAELLGEDAENFFKTGAKSLTEVIKTEDGRASNSLPPFMQPDVLARLRSHPGSIPVLFVAQPCLDLTDHPNRDELKNLVETIYQANQVRDGKGDIKTFVSGTYRSMMAIKHIRAIFPDIMHLASIASSAREMGFLSVTDPTLWGMMGADNIQQILYQEHRTRLIEIAKHCQNNTSSAQMGMFYRGSGPSTQQQKHQIAERTADELYSRPTSFTQEKLSDVYQKYLTSICNLLDKNTGCIIQKMTTPPINHVSDEEMAELFSASRGSNARLYPTTANEIDMLCRKLQACANYHLVAEKYETHVRSAYGTTHAAPTLDAAIKQSTDEFKRRIQTSRGREPWYDNMDTIVHSLQAFMNFSTKIYFAERMHIPQSALDRSVTRLADLSATAADGRRDLQQGCGAGLAGRWLTISSQLISVDEDPIQAVIKQLLIDAVEEAYTQTQLRQGHGESSMVAQRKPFFLQLAGLEYGNATCSYDNPTSFMQSLTSKFTPSKIFQTCFEMMIENFKQHARDENYTKIYELFSLLGYEANTPQAQAELQAYFCVNDKWCLSKFQKELPEKLIVILEQHPQLSFNPEHKSKVIFLDETGRQTHQYQLNSTAPISNTATQPSPANTRATMWAQGQSVASTRERREQVRDVSNAETADSENTPGG